MKTKEELTGKDRELKIKQTCINIVPDRAKNSSGNADVERFLQGETERGSECLRAWRYLNGPPFCRVGRLVRKLKPGTVFAETFIGEAISDDKLLFQCWKRRRPGLCPKYGICCSSGFDCIRLIGEHKGRTLFHTGDHVEFFAFAEVKEKSLRFRIAPESVRVIGRHAIEKFPLTAKQEGAE